MPSVQPTLTYKSTPLPYVEVYLSDLQRKNLYPANTVPTSTTGWVVNYGTGGAGSLSYPTSGGPTTAAAGYGRMTFSTMPTGFFVGAYRSQSTSFAPATAGLVHTHSMWIRTSVATVARPQLDWFNGTTLVSTITMPDVTIPANTWTRISASGVAPAGTDRARFIGYTYSAAWVSAPVGSTYDFTGVLAEQESVVNDYYAGTATPSTTPTNVTVYRLCDGETSIVRGAKNVTASGAFLVNDFEVPFGKPVTYWAETFASGTSQGLSSTNVTTVDVQEIWIHDPLDLTNTMQIFLDGDNDATLGQGSFGSISREYDYNRTSVLGKSRPVLQFYGEKAIQGLSFDVLAKAAGNSKLYDLLSVAPLMVRVPGQLGNVPRMLYGVIEGSEEPIDWHLSSQTAPLTRWKLTLTEVEPQSLDIVLTFYSYAYWQSRYSSYTAANAAYGSTTYINAVRNPPL
jgi:hypothetical protein